MQRLQWHCCQPDPAGERGQGVSSFTDNSHDTQCVYCTHTYIKHPPPMPNHSCIQSMYCRSHVCACFPYHLPWDIGVILEGEILLGQSNPEHINTTQHTQVYVCCLGNTRWLSPLTLSRHSTDKTSCMSPAAASILPSTCSGRSQD